MIGEGVALKGQGASLLKCPLFRISKVGNPISDPKIGGRDNFCIRFPK
jgi:hypothetical protein